VYRFHPQGTLFCIALGQPACKAQQNHSEFNCGFHAAAAV